MDTNKTTPFDLMLEKAEDDANLVFLNSEIDRLKAETARLRSLTTNIIDSANRYYEAKNSDEEITKILEDIVLSAGIMYKILKDKE